MHRNLDRRQAPPAAQAGHGFILRPGLLHNGKSILNQGVSGCDLVVAGHPKRMRTDSHLCATLLCLMSPVVHSNGIERPYEGLIRVLSEGRGMSLLNGHAALRWRDGDDIFRLGETLEPLIHILLQITETCVLECFDSGSGHGGMSHATGLMSLPQHVSHVPFAL
jgi:hypothetical protein